MKYALLKEDFDGQRGVVAEMSREHLLEILRKYNAEEALDEAEAELYQAFLKT